MKGKFLIFIIVLLMLSSPFAALVFASPSTTVQIQQTQKKAQTHIFFENGVIHITIGGIKKSAQAISDNLMNAGIIRNTALDISAFSGNAPSLTTTETQAGTAEITSPANNSWVGGTVNIDISATGGEYYDSSAGTWVRLEISAIYLYIDSANVKVWSPNSNTATETYSWDTTSYSDGSHKIKVEVDTQNAPDGTPVPPAYAYATYYVDNTPPTVSITSPSNGAYVRSTITLEASASDSGSGVSKVVYYYDSVTSSNEIGSSTTSPYSVSWDTTAVSDGSHTIYAVAYDEVGNTKQTSINVTVDNTPPSVSFSSPSDGSYVKGTVTVEATASDATSGIASVTFYYEPAGSTAQQEIGSVTSSPYSVSWDTTSLQDGKYTLIAVAEDKAGNVQKAYENVTVDNTPPTASITAPTGTYIHSTVSIDISASDNFEVSTITLYIDGNEVDSWTVNSASASETYSWDTTQVADGSHTVEVTVVDGAGNTYTTSKTYYVDNTPPTISVSSPSNNAWYRGTVTISATSSDTGSGVASMSIAISTLGTVQTSSSTSISYSWDTTQVSDGTYYIWVNATDNVGNMASTKITIYIDNTPPSVRITQPSNGAYVTGTITIEVSASDSGSGMAKVVYYYDSVTSSNEIGSSTTSPYSVSWDTSSVSDGTHTIYAVAYDKAGNSKQTSITITIDNSPPSVSITAPTSTYVHGTVTIDISASDSTSGIAKVVLYIDGTEITTMTTSPYSYSWDTTSYSDGSHTVKAVAYNGVGLSSSVTKTYTVDNSPPSVSIASPTSTYVHGTVTIEASASDSVSGITKVVFYIDGTEVGTATASPYSYSWDTTSYSDGNHTVEVVAYNGAGLTSSTSKTYYVDNTPPSVSITAPTGTYINGNVTIQISASDNVKLVKVELYIDGTLIKTFTSSPCTYTWDTTSYSDGNHTVKAVAYDEVNLTASASKTYTVDNTPPTITITNPTNNEWVKGTITISATATDSVSGVANMAIYIKNVGWVQKSNSGSISYSWDTTKVPDGSYVIYVYSTDEVGNNGSAQITINVDNTPPTAAVLTYPANNTYTNETTITFTWEAASDSGSGIGYYILVVYNGSGFKKEFNTTSTSQSVTLAGDGVYWWYVVAYDKVGNSEKSSVFDFTLDTVPPSVSVSESLNAFSPNGDGIKDTLTISATASEEATFTIKIYSSSGTLVITHTTTSYSTSLSWVWDGKNSNGNVVSDGTYTIYVYAKDKAGNQGVSKESVIVDTTPPNSFSLVSVDYKTQQDVIVKNSSPGFNWTASGDSGSGFSHYILVLSETKPTNLLDYSGARWIFNITKASTTHYNITVQLANGVWYWWMIAVDNVGNEIADSNGAWEFTVSTSLPTPFDLILPSNNIYTNKTAVTFEWEQSVDENVGLKDYILVLYYDEAYHNITTTNTKYNASLPTGEYSITWYVLAVNNDGATRRSNETYVLNIDTVAPTTPKAVKPSGLVGGNGVVTFVWTASTDKNFKGYELVIKNTDNGNVIYKNLTENTTSISLNDGNYSWYVVAMDKAGNTAKSNVLTFQLSTTVPRVTGYVNGKYFNKTVKIHVEILKRGTGIQCIYVYYTQDNITWVLYGKYNGTPQYVWMNLTQQGWYGVALVGEDSAGNMEGKSIDVSFFIDNTPPTGSISINNGASVVGNSTAKLDMQLSDNYGVAYYRYKMDDGSWSVWYAIPNAPKDGSYSAKIIMPNKEGQHTIYVQFMDVANNTSQVYSYAFTLDLYPPYITSYNVVPEYSKTGEVVVWVNATDNVTGVKDIIYSLNGDTWKDIAYTHSFQLMSSKEGKNTLLIKLKDGVGHVSKAYTLTFYVDTEPPYGRIIVKSVYDSLNVTIGLNATDNGTWVSYFRYSLDNSTWSNWLNYTTSFTVHVNTIGKHYIQVQFEDYVGHVSEIYSASFKVTLGPPKLSFTIQNETSEGVGWGNVVLLINATANAGISQMEIQALLAGAVVFNSGWIDYKDTYELHLSQSGEYTINVTVKDNVGSTASLEKQVYVDITPPTIESIWVQHYISFTNKTTIVVNATDNTKVGGYGYSVNGGEIVWGSSKEVVVNLPDQEQNYTIEIYVKDIWGHISSVKTWIYEIQHRPSGTLTVNSHITSNVKFTVYINATDPVFKVVEMKIKIGDKAWETMALKSEIVVDAPQDGNYTIKAIFINNVGVESNVTSTWVIVDTTPPVVNATELPKYTNQHNLTFKVNGYDTGSGISFFKIYMRFLGGGWENIGVYYVNGSHSTNITVVVTVTFKEQGVYHIGAMAYDRAGNHGGIVTLGQVIVDWVKPVVKITSGSNVTLTKTFNYTIDWSANDPNSPFIAKIIVKIYRTPLGEMNLAFWKQYNLSGNASYLHLKFANNYTYYIHIYAYDMAGNVGEATAKIIVDYNYPPRLVQYNVPQNVTANNYVTFYANAKDPNGNPVNYTWIIDGRVVGHDQFLKVSLPQGTHEVILKISDGVNVVKYSWSVFAKPTSSSTTHHPSSDSGFPGIIVIAIALPLIIAGVLAALFLMRGKKEKEEDEEDGLTAMEKEILDEVMAYLGRKKNVEYKALLDVITKRVDGATKQDVKFVIEYAVGKGLLAKEIDSEGIAHISVITSNVEIEEKPDMGGGKE